MGWGDRRRALVAGVAALVLADLGVVLAHGGSVSPVATRPAAVSRPASSVPRPAGTAVRSAVAAAADRSKLVWVRVPVATVWLHRGSARPSDRAALSTHPDISQWIKRVPLPVRENFDRRVLTQALLGEPATVIRRGPVWTKVRLTQQRGSFFRTGIPGWVPTRQLSARPVVGHAYDPAVRRPTAAAEMRIARSYLGSPYLWGGMTQAGIDCSGLVYRVFRALGRTLPRDAADQSRLGTRIPRRDLQPGDLVFFGPGARSTIHHVGFYAGRGWVLHAPHTGSRVQLSRLTRWSDYWGARRLVQPLSAGS